MKDTGKTVDGFRFMPPSLGAWIRKDIPAEEFSGNIPWIPLKNPVSQLPFALKNLAGVEYPFGREVDDVQGQREVLMHALQVFDEARNPGTVIHLPFTWHEDPRKTNWHPPEISPVIKLFLGDVKKAGTEVRAKK